MEYLLTELTAFPILHLPDETGPVHLVGSVCATCGKKVFPSAKVCSGCGGTDTGPLRLATQGVLYSYSVLQVGARGWTSPYVLGYVDFPADGVRVFGHIEMGNVELKLDGPMKVECREPIDNPGGHQVREFVFMPAADSEPLT